ncbi:hypothetical protein CC1G_10519 [Coprinopsis cinerea okayama7|uniref:Tethering factor for nuclear proteasome STS1 n=1 Tax=Coprinopsis cinerea (strain Okayama-7 / 130 / ATCC MYA-4618 / FGSC 9003) TaxID=240176 RepID=A8N198_COPC7|nr:hypothetical protein CC1G_10519 [Coprinopsis cinerea okayama7\|eukprot:XP_001828647.2 hypothetical protein CC1G_10519 [Coprinopsis cinerea okayama7\
MKRGREADDEIESNSGSRDASMDRSPTPERPKRAPPKRARFVALTNAAGQNPSTHSEKKDSRSSQEDVDVGVLLASLPTQSLLPLLTSLVKAQPELKSTILSLIPKPTLETALQALDQSARKLREAYPYSNGPSSSSSLTFGFGTHASPSQMNHAQTGMRDSYIISRLRPHITDFVSCCMSYLPYFSSASAPTQTPSSSQLTHAIQTMHKDKFHPSESFVFLQTVTNLILSQPPLTVSSMGPLLVPRLMEEWQNWVNKIDEVVNRQAGMFGIEAVRSWEKGLDDLAGAKAAEISTPMKQIRDTWVAKVGWLVGRSLRSSMDGL